MNDNELIYQLKQKNEPAFKWLVEQYKNNIYNTVLNILQNTAEAEDATQETFIQVYQSIHSFKQEASLKTWIYTIAVRKALEKLRKKKTKEKLYNVLFWGKENKSINNLFYHPGVALENKERAAVLFKAISLLPTNQRIAFTLIKIENISYAEACNIMQQSVKAIESLVMRAKINLQKQLENYYKK
jgi:RNA polymerase sigma factor (sigma-70 family)